MRRFASHTAPARQSQRAGHHRPSFGCARRRQYTLSPVCRAECLEDVQPSSFAVAEPARLLRPVLATAVVCRDRSGTTAKSQNLPTVVDHDAAFASICSRSRPVIQVWQVERLLLSKAADWLSRSGPSAKRPNPGRSDRNSTRLKAAAFPPLASSCRCHAHYMAGSPAEAEPSAFRALLPMLMKSSGSAALTSAGMTPSDRSGARAKPSLMFGIVRPPYLHKICEKRDKLSYRPRRSGPCHERISVPRLLGQLTIGPPPDIRELS